MKAEKAGRSLDIEAALQWAYRDELPKIGDGGGSLWAAGTTPMFRLAALGGPVDNWARDPGFPAALGPCHPDAVRIGEAVERLLSVEVDWAASRLHAVPEFAAMVGADDFPLRAMVIDPIPLVAMHARMGTRPTWQLDGLKAKRKIGRNGKIEVVGLHPSGRPLPGSFCPIEWSHDFRNLAVDRIEYGVWHAALVELAQELGESALESLAVTGPAASDAPWLVPDPQIVVLQDVRNPATSRGVKGRRRQRAA